MTIGNNGNPYNNEVFSEFGLDNYHLRGEAEGSVISICKKAVFDSAYVVKILYLNAYTMSSIPLETYNFEGDPDASELRAIGNLMLNENFMHLQRTSQTHV